MITKLVTHYEYFARNEARYEARNAPVLPRNATGSNLNTALPDTSTMFSRRSKRPRDACLQFLKGGTPTADPTS